MADSGWQGRQPGPRAMSFSRTATPTFLSGSHGTPAETDQLVGSLGGSELTAADTSQFRREGSHVRSLPRGAVDMVVLSLPIPATALRFIRYRTFPARSLGPVSSVHSYHTRTTRPDLGESAQGGRDGRVPGKGSEMA